MQKIQLGEAFQEAWKENKYDFKGQAVLVGTFAVGVSAAWTYAAVSPSIDGPLLASVASFGTALAGAEPTLEMASNLSEKIQARRQSQSGLDSDLQTLSHKNQSLR